MGRGKQGRGGKDGVVERATLVLKDSMTAVEYARPPKRSFASKTHTSSHEIVSVSMHIR